MEEEDEMRLCMVEFEPPLAREQKGSGSEFGGRFSRRLSGS